MGLVLGWLLRAPLGAVILIPELQFPISLLKDER
jgi:hypothetical protein